MSVLDRLYELNDTELGNVVAVAAQILAESAGPAPEDAVEMSPRAASHEVAATLEEVDVTDVQRALEDEHTSRAIAIAVLSELSRVPEIAREIEQRLAERERMLSAPELLLATGALLALAIKLKDIRIVQRRERGKSSSEVSIRFFESGAVLRNAIASIIRTIRPQ